MKKVSFTSKLYRNSIDGNYWEIINQSITHFHQRVQILEKKKMETLSLQKKKSIAGNISNINARLHRYGLFLKIGFTGKFVFERKIIINFLLSQDFKLSHPSKMDPQFPEFYHCDRHPSIKIRLNKKSIQFLFDPEKKYSFSDSHHATIFNTCTLPYSLETIRKLRNHIKFLLK